MGAVPRRNENNRCRSEVFTPAESVREAFKEEEKAGRPQRLTGFLLAASLSLRFLIR